MKAVIRSSGERAAASTCVEPVGEPLRVVGGGGGQHVVLAGEVAVQGAPRHAGGLGDLPHAEPADAPAPDQPERRDEDPLLGGAERPRPTPSGGETGVGVLQRCGHRRTY